jgi:hypothetical protein
VTVYSSAAELLDTARSVPERAPSGHLPATTWRRRRPWRPCHRLWEDAAAAAAAAAAQLPIIGGRMQWRRRLLLRSGCPSGRSIGGLRWLLQRQLRHIIGWQMRQRQWPGRPGCPRRWQTRSRRPSRCTRGRPRGRPLRLEPCTHGSQRRQVGWVRGGCARCAGDREWHSAAASSAS